MTELIEWPSLWKPPLQIRWQNFLSDYLNTSPYWCSLSSKANMIPSSVPMCSHWTLLKKPRTGSTCFWMMSSKGYTSLIRSFWKISMPGLVKDISSANMNINGLYLLMSCSLNGLIITNTAFQLPTFHKVPWMHLWSKSWHLLGYVIDKKFIKMFWSPMLWGVLGMLDQPSNDHMSLSYDIRPPIWKLQPFAHLDIATLSNLEKCIQFQCGVQEQFPLIWDLLDADLTEE